MLPVLTGLRVLELSEGVPGATAGKLLSDLGADVVFIEPPAAHAVRRLEPIPGGERSDWSPAYAYLGSNKRSMVIDAGRDAGRALIHQLLNHMDILITDLEPSRLNAIGLSPVETLTAGPSVWAALTPFGLDASLRDRAATELTLQAAGGFLYTFGDPARPPLWSRGHQMEFIAGLAAAAFTIPAVLASRRHREPIVLDLSMIEAVVTLLEAPTTHYAYSGFIRTRSGDRRRGHYMAILPCADGFIGINTVTQEHWEMLCHAFGVEHLLNDARFESGPLRASAYRELDEVFAPLVKDMRAREFYELTQGYRIACGFIAKPADLLESPQLTARGYWRDVCDPHYGAIKLPGTPFGMSGQAHEPERAAPLPGQHTFEVLAELLHLGAEDLAALHAEGVI